LKYAKLLAMVVTTVLIALVPALSDDVVTVTEWINVAIIAVGAAGVFAAPNVPGANYTKAILAVLSAVLVLLASFITDGLSGSELIQLVIAALGALGVYAVPNKGSELTPTVTTKQV
jgi:hypothetical protein